MKDNNNTGRHESRKDPPRSQPVPAQERKAGGRRERGLRKETLYVITALAAALLVMAAAMLIRNVNDGRDYDEFFEQAVSAYDCGDYNTALLYLRKAYTKEKTDECMVLMADCYTAQKNYSKALELLNSLDVRKKAIAARIEQLEQKQAGSVNVEKVSVAGKQYPVGTTGVVLDNMFLGSGVLSELTQLYALTNLSAASNGLTDIRDISALGGLTTLNLSDNSITDLSPLTSLVSLRTLYLDNNPVEDLSPLTALGSLTTLSIKGIQISDKQLAELSAALPNCAIHSEAAIKSVSDISLGGVTFKSDVTELDLSDLGIRDISALSECKNLSRLKLCRNSVSDLSPLMDIPGLMWLDITDNAVSDLSPIMGIGTICCLEADGNSISSTAPLSMLTGLVELHLDGNRIRDFSGLRGLRSLETLSLNSTGLTDRDLENFTGLNSLRLLYVEDNEQLTKKAVDELNLSLANCAIRHSEFVVPISLGGREFTADMNTVDASNLGISELSALRSFEKLEKLLLSDNLIESIDVFRHLGDLHYLDLAGNSVSDITPLYALDELEYLDLSYNSISSLTALSSLSSLRQLYLYGNPIPDEELSSLREALPECEIHF